MPTLFCEGVRQSPCRALYLLCAASRFVALRQPVHHPRTLRSHQGRLLKYVSICFGRRAAPLAPSVSSNEDEQGKGNDFARVRVETRTPSEIGFASVAEGRSGDWSNVNCSNSSNFIEQTSYARQPSSIYLIQSQPPWKLGFSGSRASNPFRAAGSWCQQAEMAVCICGALTCASILRHLRALLAKANS